MKATVVFISLVALLMLALATSFQGFSITPPLWTAYGAFSAPPPPVPPSTSTYEEILFTGDVLLARDVENYMDSFGDGYPLDVFSSFSSSTAVVVNFESSIPEFHRTTPFLSTRFSSPSRVAALLREHEIEYASLANNHSFDFGNDGFQNTVETFRIADVKSFGHPLKVSTTSSASIPLIHSNVGVLAIHFLATEPNLEDLKRQFTHLSKDHDYIVAYVHWGEEYKSTNNQSQRLWAERLIDLGFDGVVGHHPHVVQNIDMYQGKPIFYSLGNLIFDQYFSQEVQEGLMVRLHMNEGEVTYELLPVTSVGSKTRPRLLTGTEKVFFLESLAKRSHKSLTQKVKSGKITFTR